MCVCVCVETFACIHLFLLLFYILLLSFPPTPLRSSLFPLPPFLLLSLYLPDSSPVPPLYLFLLPPPSSLLPPLTENTLREGFPRHAPVVMYKLRKEYPGPWGKPPHIAVHSVSLAIQRNECFGLLGPNGIAQRHLHLSFHYGLISFPTLPPYFHRVSSCLRYWQDDADLSADRIV